jgi:hypothetical protein
MISADRRACISASSMTVRRYEALSRQEVYSGRHLVTKVEECRRMVLTFVLGMMTGPLGVVLT